MIATQQTPGTDKGSDNPSRNCMQESIRSTEEY